MRVHHVNTVRRRLQIEENAVQVNGEIVVGTPKSWQMRSVPYPAFLTPLLERAARGKNRNDLLFGDGKTYVKPSRFGNGWFDGAISRVQMEHPDFPRVTPHDLRHTAASLAVAAGANVKALQRMLGYESASIALDTYADLFDDDLDVVADRLEDAARSQSVGKPARTGDLRTHDPSVFKGFRAAKTEPTTGFEPVTSCLQDRCSTS